MSIVELPKYLKYLLRNLLYAFDFFFIKMSCFDGPSGLCNIFYFIVLHYRLCNGRPRT